MTRRLRSLLLAALFVGLTQSALGAPPSSVTEEEKRAAQKMFEAGDGLYESGRYEDAVAAFKNSHQLVASPNSRLMLARSLRESGNNAEACEQFRGTIQDAEASGGRYPEALQAAQSELGALEAIIAKGESEKKSMEPAPATPATTPRTKEDKPPVATHAASTPQPPRPAPSNPLRWAAFGSAGVGVVGLAAFGVFGYLNHKAYGDLESSCSRNRCPSSSADEINEGRRYQLIANVGLGVAAVGAIAATTLFVLLPRKEPGGANVALQVTPAALLIDGSF